MRYSSVGRLRGTWAGVGRKEVASPSVTSGRVSWTAVAAIATVTGLAAVAGKNSAWAQSSDQEKDESIPGIEVGDPLRRWLGEKGESQQSRAKQSKAKLS